MDAHLGDAEDRSGFIAHPAVIRGRRLSDDHAIVVKDIHMRCELLARKLCQRLW